MSSPSPKLLAQYDYDEIRGLLGEGWSWTRLGKYYGRDRRNVERWYERQRMAKSAERKRSKKIHGNKIRHKNKKDTLVSKNISRNYDPSRNPPTGYISTLSNDEWINHYFGGDGFMPTGHEWEPIEYLTELRELVWNELNLITIEPRGHGKTTSVIELFVRYLLEVRRPLLCIKSGNAGARWMFGEVRKLLMRTDKLREDYGDIMESMNRSTQEMYYAHEVDYASSDPAFKCVGKGGEIIGLHSGWIHLDDIVQEEGKSEMTREGLRNWYDDVVKYCVVRGDNPTRITITGTRKDTDDWYSYIMTKAFKQLHKRALEVITGRLPHYDECIFDEHGYLISWPDVGTYETLNCPNWDLRDLLQEYFDDPIGFASQMQGEPIPRGGRFFTEEEWIEVDNPIVDYTGNHTFVDPAWGKTAGSSDSAILVVSVYNKDLVLLDASIGKFDPVMLESETVRLSTEWKSIGTHLENNFAQVTSRYSEDRPIRNLRGSRTFEQSIDKIMRIDGLKAPFSTRRIQIHASCSFKDKIKAQFLKYNRRVGAWDILDCLSTAYLYMSRYMRTKVSSKIEVGIHGSRFE